MARTRIYRLVSGKRCFIVFKEEVSKKVNLVEMANEKVMETVFLKLEDYMHSIATSYQWEKYYSKPYAREIKTI